MQYRTLGKTGLKVSVVSFGTGGPSQFGQKTGLAEAGRLALVRRCLELGINLFDTAQQYGQSEALLAAALEGVPRDAYILSSKWSQRRGDELKRPEELAPAVDESLKRLRTDYIEIMQFHAVFPHEYDAVVERFYPEMERLRDAGKVRFIGITEMILKDPEHVTAARAVKEHPRLWDTLMLKYGILNQWAAREVLPLAEQHDIGVLNMAPVRLTLSRSAELRALMDEWRKDGSVPVDRLDPEDPLGWLVKDGVDSVIAAGYKFAASHPAISTVITGTSNVQHLDSNAAATAGPPLSSQDYARLVEIFGNSAAPK